MTNKKNIKSSFTIICLAFCLLAFWGQSIATPAERSKELLRWTDRLIPLPKEVEVIGSLKVPASEIKLEQYPSSAPQIRTAISVLRQFAKAEAKEGTVTISMGLVDENNRVSQNIKRRLTKLPNKEQAYAIISFSNEKKIHLIANNPTGLLFASRTLSQLVSVPPNISPETVLEIPFAKIIDWPDMEERGMWRWSPFRDARMRFFSKYKINHIKLAVECSIDKLGHPMVKDEKSRISSSANLGEELGIKVFGYLGHIAYVGSHALRIVPYKEELKHLLPAVSLDKNGEVRSLNLTNPTSVELISGWFKQIAELMSGYTNNIEVWLSEGESRYNLKDYPDEHPFILETKMILKAFEKIKEEYPKMRLRLQLSQGTHAAKVHEKIIDLLPPDVGLVYYHGGLTYTSDKKPMIYPLLEEFSRSGRFLGVVPQFTNSWITVLPWTGPQFVHFRAKEFVDKKLSSIDGYFIPDTRYHEFNLLAMAEWTWNANGRTPEEFARAYATHRNICEPGLFARWALKAGEAGWGLAESGFFAYLRNDPSLGFYGAVPFDYRFGGKCSIANIDNMNEILKVAHEALVLAHKSGNLDMINESEFTYAALNSFHLLNQISEIVRASSVDESTKKSLAEKMDQLDQCAHAIRPNVYEWGERISGREYCHRRMARPVCAILRTCDTIRNLVRPFGITDPLPESRPVEIGEWTVNNFSKGVGKGSFDITDMVPKSGGLYNVSFDYLDGIYVHAAGIKLIGVNQDGKEKILSVSPDASGWGYAAKPFTECRIAIPEKKEGFRYLLNIEMWPDVTMRERFPEKMPEKRQICSGIVGLRRIWKRGEFPSGRVSKLLSQTSEKEGFNLDRTIIEKLPELATPKGSKIQVGVYKAKGDDKIISVLNREKDINAFLFPLKFSLEDLKKCDVFLLLQSGTSYRLVRTSGIIINWVQDGGRIMCFHDAVGYRTFMAMFKSVGSGKTNPKLDNVRVIKAHPVTKGLSVGDIFSPGFHYDHVTMNKGPAGEVLIESENGDPVLIVGKVGKGKVILNGMCTGFAGDKTNYSGNAAEPKGGELKVLLNGVRWLGERFKTVDSISENNLMINGDVEERIDYRDYPAKHGLTPAEYLARGWGAYTGGPEGVWGVTDKEAHSGKYSMFLTLKKFYIYKKGEKKGQKIIGINLLLGEGDGYTGENSIKALPDTTYAFSFWMKGNAPRVSVTFTYWRDPKRNDGRGWSGVKDLRCDGRAIRPKGPWSSDIISPTSDWMQYSGKFTTREKAEKFVIHIGFSGNIIGFKEGQTIYVDDAKIWVVN